MRCSWIGCATRSPACRATTAGSRWRVPLRDDLYRVHRNLAGQALQDAAGAEAFAQQWMEKRHHEVEVCAQMFAELQSFSALDLAMLSAGMRELSNHLLS